MADDADLAIVVKRKVDVRTADEVHRHATADRTADRDADAVAGPAIRQQPERGREDRARAVLRPAEEAPRPLPRLDPLRCELDQLGAERIRAL